MTDALSRALAAMLQLQRTARDAQIASLDDTYEPDLADLDEGLWPANAKSAAAIWAARELQSYRRREMTDAERVAFAAVSADPTPRTLSRLSDLLRGGVTVHGLLDQDDLGLDADAAAKRVDWYAALMGDRDAAARTAARVYEAYISLSTEDGPDTAWRHLVTLSRVLHAASPTGSLQRDDLLARTSLHTMGRLIEADRLLRANEPPTKLQEIARRETPRPTHRELMDDDRAGIVRLAPPAAPSLVVVRSVDHLPMPAKHVSRSDHARAEAGPIAGRALPLMQPPPNLVEIREGLRREYPHATAAIDVALVPVAGQAWIRLPNLLLHGPAGTGKSELAQALGRALGLGVDVYSCAGASDGSFAGTSRAWSTARFCVSLQAIIRWQQANGALVLDEVDKAGTGSQNGLLTSALLPFLEPTTSRAIRDPYLEAEVDLSALSYVATANDISVLPRPLLDRFTLIEVPEPSWEHLGDLAAGIVERLRRERQTDENWMPALDGEEIGVLGDWWKGGSIRRLRRLVERVVDARSVLAPRH